MKIDQRSVDNSSIVYNRAEKINDQSIINSRSRVQQETESRIQSMSRDWNAQDIAMSNRQDNQSQKNRWAGQLGREQQMERAVIKQVLAKDPKIAMVMQLAGDQATDQLIGAVMGKNPLDRTVLNLAGGGLIDTSEALAAWGISFIMMLGNKLLKVSELSWYVHLAAWAVFFWQLAVWSAIVFLIVVIVYPFIDPIGFVNYVACDLLGTIFSLAGISLPEGLQSVCSALFK